MIGLPATVRVFVAVEPADLRKGYDGLARLARDVIDQDPLSGHLFVFAVTVPLWASFTTTAPVPAETRLTAGDSIPTTHKKHGGVFRGAEMPAIAGVKSGKLAFDECPGDSRAPPPSG